MDYSSSDSDLAVSEMSLEREDEVVDNDTTSNAAEPPQVEDPEPPLVEEEPPDPLDSAPPIIDCPPTVEPFPPMHPNLMSSSEEDELSELACKDQLVEIAREWVMTQLGKVCSNEVADSYFSMAWDLCEKFARIKAVMDERKPSLKQLRRKIVEENVPGIKLDYVIRDTNVEEEVNEPIYLYNLAQFPAKRYPLSRYEILNQITRIDVSFLTKCLISRMFVHQTFDCYLARHLHCINHDIYSTYSLQLKN